MSEEKPQSGLNGGDGSLDGEKRFLHDIATPLAIAAGLVELLLDDEDPEQPLPEGHKRRLEKACTALEKLKNLIRDRRNFLLDENNSAQQGEIEKKAS